MSLSKHNHVNLFSSSFQIFCNNIYFEDFFHSKMILSRNFHKFFNFFKDPYQNFMIFVLLGDFFIYWNICFIVLKLFSKKKYLFFNILYTFYFHKIFFDTLFSCSMEKFFQFFLSKMISMTFKILKLDLKIS